MTSFTSQTLIILLIQVALLPMLLHCRVFFPMDENLITQTCQKTKDPAACEGLLRSDSRSLEAKDATALVFIVTDISQTKANQGQKKIEELLRAPGAPTDKLNSCNENYQNVIEDIQQASSVLTNGDYLAAQDRILDTVHEADLCDEQFAGSDNPLSGYTKAIHDTGTVGSEIAGQLTP
ncbi:hypothetical protein FF1_021769 [Malus domestica]|nr:pectinesterase inhibitor-like [Malus sylvestris]